MAGINLVIGASGFLGSHVTKQLVMQGDDVRVLIRTTSSTRGIDGLPVDIRYGDIFDTPALQDAMAKRATAADFFRNMRRRHSTSEVSR